jgi:hypothetical protein
MKSILIEKENESIRREDITMKDLKRYQTLWLCLAALATMSFVGGCVWTKDYGRLTTAPDSLTIEKLQENWMHYDIWYSGVADNLPSAVMFHPKGDEYQLEPENGSGALSWVPITSKDRLRNAITALQAMINYPPDLMEILGPEGHRYGYLYSYYNAVEMKVVAPKTLWVRGIPLPPFDYGPGSTGHSK